MKKSISKRKIIKSMPKPKTAASKITTRDQGYLNRFSFESRFDNPEKLPNFYNVQYEELIKDMENRTHILTKNMASIYLEVFYLKKSRM